MKNKYLMYCPAWDNIQFDEDSHRYFVGGEEVPCVTSIVKVVFGDMYARVKKKVLERCAKKGSLVHTEIEEYIKDGKKGFTQEFFNVKAEIDKIGLKAIGLSEQKVLGETPFGNYCGTVDLYLRDGTLVDFKSCHNVKVKAYARQLNMYAHALRMQGFPVEKIEIWHTYEDTFEKIEVKQYDTQHIIGIMGLYNMEKNK